MAEHPTTRADAPDRAAGRARLVRPLGPRSPDEEHRAATPLELFFDLCFVVAVAQAADGLHHALAEADMMSALVGYPSVFFAVWWAWMNFTWFASAYDNDDVPYRLTVLVQIAGVLILAAGVPRAFADEDFGVVTLGYAVMRVGLVVQWLRAAGADPERRATAVRYAVGVSACMAGWGLRLLLPDGWRLPSLVAMAALELLVPVWAERGTTTTWHPRHIAERYGLFTLIVLGESVLAATVALQSALDSGEALGDLLTIAVGGLLVVFSMWWVYFAQPADRTMEAARRAFGITSNFSFVWGYGHVVVFAAAAAVGAGIAVAVDEATHHAELSGRGAALSVAVPAALYVLTIWALHGGHRQARTRTAHAVSFPLAAAAVVVAAAVTGSVLVVGLLMAALVATFLLSGEPTPAGGSVVVDGG